MARDTARMNDKELFELFCRTRERARDLPRYEAYAELRLVIAQMSDTDLRQWATFETADALDLFGTTIEHE